jgi:polysaccharide deacetylase family protein (PEP-CTERM system associated)
MSWIAFSVDVEEWFHILDTDRIPPRSEWDNQPNHVVRNTHRILDLLDRAAIPSTFFTLGWVAERQPDLIREIARRGHEVASHGHEHELAYRVGRSAFREDAMRSKSTLEDVIGEEIVGFRAAGFSITEQTPWAFEELASLGFRYDSSVFPARRGHGGFRGAPSIPHRICSGGSGSLIEFPIAPLETGPFRFPFSGGGYLRFFPVPVVRWCLEHLLAREIPATIYIHPREVDPNHPRLPLPPFRRFKTYVNVARCEEKVAALLQSFPAATFRRLRDAVDDLEKSDRLEKVVL